MRIGIYDPYLDTLGGGEKYILSIASYLSKKNQVDLFWNDKSIVRKAEQKLNLSLKSVFVRENIFTSRSSFLKRIKESYKYDLIILVSDGSLPFLFAKRTILIFQFPVNWIGKKNLFNKIKLKNIEKIICYTNFVKKYIDKTFGINAHVLYPPVEYFQTSVPKKENIILSVGRFTKAMNQKKQEILIQAFIDMVDNGLKDWKFVVAGSYLPQDSDLVKSLEKKSSGYPIEIASNISHSALSDFYKKAKIYWHAAGFGEDLEKYPERAEHFGITTVEAMSAGCAPVVINEGGQKEIIENGKNGFLWDSLDQLQDKTHYLMKNDSVWQEMSDLAKKRAKDFNQDKFCKELEGLLQ